jgi:hypothetical protein
MANKPKFRRPGRPSRWQEVRDWLNILAAVGTILIGVGTLWVTARISGLEDYFQSEISSKNSQLSSVIEESATAARQLRANEQQLTDLRAITDATIATALETQAQMSGSTASLLAVQSEIARERASLGEARAQLRTLGALTEQQRATLALLFAREVHDRAVFGLSSVMLVNRVTFREPRSEVRVPFGRLAFAEFERLALGRADDAEVGPVYQRLLTRLPDVCPGFIDREVVAQAIPERASRTQDDYPRGLSQREVAALAQSRLDSDVAQIVARTEVIEGGINSYTDRSIAFMTYSQNCICDALVSKPAERPTVCGVSS